MKLRLPVIAALLGLAGLAAAVVAQIEGDDRGVPVIDTSSNFEVSGIAVDVRAKTADAARLGGWRIAQRRAWGLLWAKMHGGSTGAPQLGDSALDGIVAGIVIDEEQIGPNRYVAKLGVLFDRARAGQILGTSGQISRSSPLLVLPVEWSGGTPTSFERRTEWQKAWARFRTDASPIDYVRVSGQGADPLLLTIGQAQRPGRRWWRMLLDTYGASDVLIPQVRVDRLWPGGPAIGHFTARFGPDNRMLASFVLRVESSDAIPAMMDAGVKRMDEEYSRALALGELRPDPSLVFEMPVDPDALLLDEGEGTTIESDGATAGAGLAGAITVQFETPDVVSVTAIESAVRGVPGVSGVSTTSLALGGVSVMQVAFAGDIAALRAALQGRGFRVEEGGGALRIRRTAPAAPAPAADPAPAP